MVAYSFRPRFVVPIKLGLGLPYAIDDIMTDLETASRPKRQTIRAIGRRRHARPGDIIQLYTGMRTKQCRSIGVAKCIAVTPIEIRFDDVVFWVFLPASSTRMARITGDRLKKFAEHDGFASVDDMATFWRDEHESGIFKGILIEWEPING